MLGMLWRSMRHRSGRSLTLALGILVAAVSFSLLTAAARTGTARVQRTVAGNFRAAYDILVRPPGSTTALERDAGLVRQNYLSGIFGGISRAQWRTIQHLPGVSIAAPIAMVGYVLPFFNLPVDVTSELSSAQRQVFRLRVTWTAENGLSRFVEPPSYIYVTRHREVSASGRDVELAGDLPGGQSPVCDGLSGGIGPATNPFSRGARSGLFCWSTVPGSNRSRYGLPRGHVGARIAWPFPFLLAAIDPVQEARLVGLNHAVTDGRYLTETDRTRPVHAGSLEHLTAPVLTAGRAFIDDTMHITVQRLRLDAHQIAAISLSRRPDSALDSSPAATVRRGRVTPAMGYKSLLRHPLQVGSYWKSSPVQYQRLGPAQVMARTTTNATSVWFSRTYGLFPAPLDNADTAFRKLTSFSASSTIQGNVLHFGYLKPVGTIDASRLPGFNPLTRVPLSTYNPPDAPAADARSRRLLGNTSLSPDANIAGYLQPPPLLLTTLNSMSLFTNPANYIGASPNRPISAIRVRVGDLHGSTRQQLAQIGQVALAIKTATGLQVDVTAGASPTSVTVDLPTGKFGRPALSLAEPWVRKGVAVAILTAVDRKSAILFGLILLVTACFLANGAFAAVRARRTEIGVLRCMGWSRPAIMRLILGELTGIGLLAGLAGTGIAAALIASFGFDLPLARVLLVTPVAITLAALAGAIPAWHAGRGQPLDAVQPAAVAAHKPGRPVRRLIGLGLSNLRRMPGRAALAAFALAVGVGALTVLLAVQFDFGRDIAGSALGGFVTTQVRGVDYFSAALAITLGAASVADVLYLNLRERAPEFAALAASGWQRRHLIRVGWTEGTGIGIVGSLIGAGAGLSITAALGAPAGQVILAAAVAAAGGIAVVLLTARLVLVAVGRLSLVDALAEA